MYYMNDKPLQYLLDSVPPSTDRTRGGGVKTPSAPLPGVPYKIKQKEDTSRQMNEKKQTDQSVYKVSEREKDVVRYDPKKIVTDNYDGQKNKELIPGVPDIYTYIGGGVVGLGLLFMIFRD